MSPLISVSLSFAPPVNENYPTLLIRNLSMFDKIKRHLCMMIHYDLLTFILQQISQVKSSKNPKGANLGIIEIGYYKPKEKKLNGDSRRDHLKHFYVNSSNEIAASKYLMTHLDHHSL